MSFWLGCFLRFLFYSSIKWAYFTSLLYFEGILGLMYLSKCIFWPRGCSRDVSNHSRENWISKIVLFCQEIIFSVSFWTSIFIAISRQFFNSFFSRYGLLKPCSSMNSKQLHSYNLPICEWKKAVPDEVVLYCHGENDSEILPMAPLY